MARQYELLEARIKDEYIREALRRVKSSLIDLDARSDSSSGSVTPPAVEAAKLVFVKKANVNISAFQMVRLISSTHVDITSNNSYVNSLAIGIALESKVANEDIRVLTFGIAEDPSFTFAINLPLFLSSSGTITSTPTTISGEFVTQIGQSLGTGAIFINISEPVEIL